MAAVLACGPDAVLSHRSAAALWGFGEEHPAYIDVSVRAPPKPASPASAATAAPPCLPRRLDLALASR